MRIIQIATLPETENYHPQIVALTDTGEIFITACDRKFGWINPFKLVGALSFDLPKTETTATAEAEAKP